MAHPQPSLSSPLDADRHALLDDLERVGQPTPYARGALRALSLAALDPADRRRVDALSVKWASS